MGCDEAVSIRNANRMIMRTIFAAKNTAEDEKEVFMTIRVECNSVDVNQKSSIRSISRLEEQ